VGGGKGEVGRVFGEIGEMTLAVAVGRDRLAGFAHRESARKGVFFARWNFDLVEISFVGIMSLPADKIRLQAVRKPHCGGVTLYPWRKSVLIAHPVSRKVAMWPPAPFR